MQIFLNREIFTDTCTIGKLLIPESDLTLYTLEDFDRNLYQQTPLQDIMRAKVFGETAIPYGTYEVAITFSNRFKKLMPQILDVPGFAGIRIHAGNFHTETEGCPLVGMKAGDNMIYRSRVAYSKLFPILQQACSKEKVFITIHKPHTA